MAGKVICPYCPESVEMEAAYMFDTVADEHSLSGVSYMRYAQYICPACRSTSPRAITQEAALRLALRCGCQPNRVLTLDEVKAHIAESHDVPSLYVEFKTDFAYVVHWRNGDSISHLLLNRYGKYGVSWRCWLREPTEKERRNAPWEG